MKTEEKLNRIKELSKDEFASLLQLILSKMGVQVNTVEKDRPIIHGEESNLVNTLEYRVIYFTELLSGDLEDTKTVILELINEEKKKKKGLSFVIVSTHNISKGFQEAISNHVRGNLLFWGGQQILEHLDKYEDSFWYSNDPFLSAYEKDFLKKKLKFREVIRLKDLGEKYERMLQVFIEPKILRFRLSENSEREIIGAATVQQIANELKTSFLVGEAGTGKTTILGKIGEILIDGNSDSNLKRKRIPVFLEHSDITSANSSLRNAVIQKVTPFFSAQEEELFVKYQFVVLIDSLDELPIEERKRINKEMIRLGVDSNAVFVVGTRHIELPFTVTQKREIGTYLVERFDYGRAKLFFKAVFKDEDKKVDNLIESFEENRILERMPITPLTLSLISILYEEHKYEIPSTITDVFDLFSSFLLGKLNVSSRLEFLEIHVRERFLSKYALVLMRNPNRRVLTIEEFRTFFVDFMKTRGANVSDEIVTEALNHLIDHSGILELHKGQLVRFTNDSFLEYFAAVEIFQHERESEGELIENFLDTSWQNVALFYAGKSKDMPTFLEKILNRISGVENLDECMLGVMGLGYLLQALYMTDAKARSAGIDVALSLNLRAFETFKRVFSQQVYFKGFTYESVALISIILFRQNFNSITLREPLIISFDRLLSLCHQGSVGAMTFGFEAIQVALTLGTERIGYEQALEVLLEHRFFKNDALFLELLQLGISMTNNTELFELRKVLKRKVKDLEDPIKAFKEPVSKVLFGPADLITPERKVFLSVEGPTDLKLLSHAYMVLTGKQPFWSYLPASKLTGANEVTKSLYSRFPIEDRVLIGIYDRDSKGYQEFNGGLKAKDFDICTFSSNVKKKHGSLIFGLILPLFESGSVFETDDSRFMVFELEHYLPLELLQRVNGIKLISAAPNLYEIRDSAKGKIVEEALKSNDKSDFQNFEVLFRLIDQISGVDGISCYS